MDGMRNKKKVKENKVNEGRNKLFYERLKKKGGRDGQIEGESKIKG